MYQVQWYLKRKSYLCNDVKTKMFSEIGNTDFIKMERSKNLAHIRKNGDIFIISPQRLVITVLIGYWMCLIEMITMSTHNMSVRLG